MAGLKRDIRGHVVQALKPRLGSVQILAIGAAEAHTTAFRANTPQNEAGSALQNQDNDWGTTHVRLCAQGDCFVAIGPAGTVVTATTGFLLPASTPEYFPVNFGDIVSVIQSGAATGNLYVSECE